MLTYKNSHYDSRFYFEGVDGYHVYNYLIITD